MPFIFHAFSLFLTLAIAESGMVSNRGFKLNSSDDCMLYGDYCIESKGYSSGKNYNPDARCNITVIYEKTCQLVDVGPFYEVEPGEKDYFLINGILFSQFCDDFFTRYLTTRLSNGSKIYWHTDGTNEYKGWRFCLSDPSDGYALQDESSHNCVCNGVGLPFTGLGSICGVHNQFSNTPWCY